MTAAHQVTMTAEQLRAACSGKLLDALLGEQGLKNDAALSRFLDVAPPVISKLRHGRFSVSGDMMIRIHEKTDMPIKRIKELVAA